MLQKIAMITGISGMDASYLSRYLLSLDYQVIGIARRNSTPNTARTQFIDTNPNLKIIYGDVTDGISINRLVAEYKPDEFYHLAANSFVSASWDTPNHVIETNTIGTVNCLEAVRKFAPECHFYFASSSETFGEYIKKHGGTITEDTPQVARSAYGVSKIAGQQMTRIYRESYNMFAACGILFNHSECLRGEEFFTRKVTSQLARVHWGLQKSIELGNLEAKRDEGSSIDYVKAMVAILQHKEPDDFIIATGETHSCQEWLDLTLDYFGIDKSVVHIDKTLFRPNEVNVLVGDFSKAKQLLGWQPTISFSELNEKMCKFDWYAQSPDLIIKSQAKDYLFKEITHVK